MGFGMAALVALVRQEQRAAFFPLLPISLLSRPNIWRSDALAACHGATLVSLITFLPIYMRVGQKFSAAETGLMLLPLMFGIGIGSMITGRVVSRTGRTTIFPSIGLIVAALSLVALALLASSLSRVQLSCLLFFNGLFMGTVMGVVQVIVQNEAGTASLGAPAASVQLSRSIGAAVGTALVGTVLFATLALSDLEAAQLFGAMVRRARRHARGPARGASSHDPIGGRGRLPQCFPHGCQFRRRGSAARLDDSYETAELSWSARGQVNVTLPSPATRPRQPMAPIPL